jgi:hypothetical protein
MPAPSDEAATFAEGHPGSEAIVQRIGARSAQVILVAPGGEWLRVVVASVEEGRALCERLAVPDHDGWSDDLRRRVTSWRRPPSDWAKAPYPERGRQILP